jgi:hypothetical protein
MESNCKRGQGSSWAAAPVEEEEEEEEEEEHSTTSCNKFSVNVI